MKSSKIRLGLLVGLALALAGLSAWNSRFAHVAASSSARAQSNSQPQVVAAATAFKQAVAAYQANPTPVNAAAVESARAAYDQAVAVRSAEIRARLAQLFPNTSLSHAVYEKGVNPPSEEVLAEANSLLAELRSYDPPTSMQNAPDACPNNQTITHSSSQAITSNNSVSCNQVGLHTDNSYWRAFNLPSFGINGQFNVSSVQIGVEVANGASGSQPITVRIHRTTSGVFPTGTRALITSAGFSVPNSASGTVITVPIAANVPAGSEMIVEIFTPNGQAAGNSFFIGSNASPETGPSYLSAADCGVPNPTPTANIGFPNMHIVMNVIGCEQIVCAGPNAPKGASCAVIISAGATLVSESCTPANGAIDPGETVTLSFCVQNTGNANTTNLVGTLQATGGVTSPSGPQTYGVVVAGGAAVCRNFTFTATGTCGGTLTATIQMQDGATNLGNVTYTFTFGTQAVAFSENFDGVSVPNLPVGWTSTEAADPGNVGNPWATNATNPDTAPNDAFTNDPNNITDQRLDTPTISITTGTAQLTFRNNFSLESNFDGGVLEISSPNINAGAFTDITAAAVGGSFVSGGYNGTISTAFGSPIAGRMAWTGSSNGYITTVVNLGPNVAGRMIKLRWRMGSDNSVSVVGWRVDTIRITDGFACSACATQCGENFDSVTPPALPAGWSATVGATCATTARWVTVNTTNDTAPNSAFVNDPNCISDERLDSKPFPIVSAAAVLSFRRNNNLESGFDGMVLEISNPAVNAGAFQDIITAGGSFVTGGYNATISVSFGNPIAGRMAWSGNTGGFVTTTVNLPANANGQSIVLRWRRGSDNSVSAVGAFIDTITITGSNCGLVPCVLTCPANITKSNDPNQCGAVVTYPAPTSTGTCGTVTCSPASGSFFPVGTTTVTCSSSAGAAPEVLGAGASFDVPDGSKAPAGAGSSGGSGSKGGTTAGASSGINAGAIPATSNSGAGIPKGSPGSFPKSPFAILYDQNNNPAPVPGGVTSQNFETAFDAFDAQAADDFVVPAGQTWTVQQVFVVGEYSTGAATSANVFFFSDSATLPGAAVYTATNQPIADVAGDFTITLTVPAVLTAGTYWVSVQANENFTGGGQWFWDNRTTISNSGAAWRNPGGGFGVGCTTFGRKTTCLTTQNGPDQLFQILGTSAASGGGSTCTFTVTVQDTQPPTITCPANVTAVTDQNCAAAACQVVTFPAPTASDNCPGVTVVCNPPSGSCVPIGVTTVTCTATDASGNTATCSFTISTFDVALQDDSNPSIILLWNSLTGAYRFCCNGTTFTGIGKSTIQGCVFTLQHDPSDRRVLGRVDKAVHAGTASLQSPPGITKCTITDRNTLNDTNLSACQ
jgi:hypothetical protein